MINVGNRVRKAWYELLNGNTSVPVYGGDVPITETGNHILLRIESDSDTPNNQKFISNPVIITEVVTRFSTMIDDSIAGEIDEEIGELLFPTTVAQHALPAQADIHITSVQRRDATYLQEDDGTYRYYRLITRNVHRVEQLVNQS
jgi:hypothetical protein